MSEKKLFILDAYALIYRSYYAFIKNPRINSKGLNTSAIFGFTNTLLDVIKTQKPTHLAVAFDFPSETLRQQDYADYKANREETPEDIKKSIPIIMEIIKGFDIPILMVEGYEADDVIGTIVKKAEKQGFTSYMMTPDKDFGQLVSEHTFMFKPGRSGKPAEVWGVKEVCESFEIEHPTQVIDILGLWGDASDNIPGIPGIGEKTAKTLISKYGSVENLIANAENDLKGKQKDNVIAFASQGLMSKQLATIILDVPVDFNPNELILSKPNEQRLIELFSELEFRTLAQRAFGVSIQSTNSEGQLDMFSVEEEDDNQTEVVVSDFKTIENTEHSYHLVKTEQEIKHLVAKLSALDCFCFDTETDNIEAIDAQLVGMSFSFNKGEAYYVAIPLNKEKAEAILAHFKPVLENEKIEKVAHNIKYDLAVLRNYGVDVKGSYFDTMIAHYLIKPDMRHNMDVLAETYLGYSPVSIETLIGKKGKNQKSMADLTPEEIVDYASEDADITWQLKDQFKAQITKSHLDKIYHDIESPLVSVLEKMEREGVNVDKEALKSMSKDLAKDLIAYEEKIYQLSGEKFNIDSPRQLGEVLFDKMKIPAKIKKTKTGQYATNEETLDKLRDTHEIFDVILDYRSTKKLKSTYVDALPELINKRTGRLHTNYMQTVAATGRLSSINPNLQNIPIRTEKGREIRKAFIPRNNDYTLLAADYSQIELRIIAALSEDKSMIDAFNSGTDIHSVTASKVFKVGIDEVTRDMRSKAKMVNFGIIYGISAFGLSQRLSIPRKDAKEIIDNYFEQYYKVKEYMDNAIKGAREKGYVETLLGRRRTLKDINSSNAIVRGHAERNAINAPIQGTAADIIKIAMINIDKAFDRKKLQSKMILQVHDELVFDVLKPEVEAVQEIVIHEMENAVKIAVPLTVESSTGSNWLEAH